MWHVILERFEYDIPIAVTKLWSDKIIDNQCASDDQCLSDMPISLLQHQLVSVFSQDLTIYCSVCLVVLVTSGIHQTFAGTFDWVYTVLIKFLLYYVNKCNVNKQTDNWYCQFRIHLRYFMNAFA